MNRRQARIEGAGSHRLLAGRRRQERRTRRAEKKNETRVARYSDLFEHAPIGLLTVDREGRIGLINHGAARLFGADAASLAGRRIGGLVSAESRSRLATFLAGLIEGGNRMICEIEIASKEGSPKTIEFVGMRSEDQSEFFIVAADITENKKTATEMKLSHAALRNLSARLVAIREEERRQLARELHDGLGQILTALKLDLAWLQRRIERFGDPEKRMESLSKARELQKNIDEAIAIVRRAASGLRPATLDIMGLWPAIEGEAARFSSRTGIPCVVHPLVQSDRLRDATVSVALFRIVQEALTNIARHAKASLVEIACGKSKAGYSLSIVDDGRGIGKTESANPNSLGLIGMRERALSFGGEFSIVGTPGSGSRVEVTIPKEAFRGKP